MSESIFADDKIINTAYQAALRLQGRYQTLKDESMVLLSDVQIANNKLSYKPELDYFMDELQQVIHKKTVGKFERLLTGILRDVMPGVGNVKITVETKRQMPHLSITVSNGKYSEDAFNARGGSIANILSLGLRFIALTRFGLRPFIVLDEPDCWLKPDKIPAFISVINALSKNMGIQVLMITHHVESFFKECASLVHLKSDRRSDIGKIRVHELLGQKYQWTDEQKGIRSIRLKNFLSYEDVTIPLSPGFTIMIGDNDIGKSGSIMLLRSLIKEEWSDAYIRHGETAACGIIDMGPEGQILSARTNKGSNKTCHAYSSAGLEQSGEAPKWLSDLGIDFNLPTIHHNEHKSPPWLKSLGFDVGDMEIQIGHQKKPVFLLDKTGSQQAAILSIDLECAYLNEMQSLYKGDIKKLNDTRKAGEIRLDKIKKELAILEPINQVVADLDNLKQLRKCAIQESEAIVKLESLIANIDRSQFIIEKLKHISLQEIPMQSPLQETESIVKAIQLLNQADRISAFKPIDTINDKITLQDTKSLLSTGRLLKQLQSFSNTGSIELLSEPPELTITAERHISTIESIYAEKTKMENAINDLKKQSNMMQAEVDAYIEENGGCCPSCGQFIEHQHEHDHDQNERISFS